MRFSTIASLLVAVLLAASAVFGAQVWLSSEQQQLANAIRDQFAAESENDAEEAKETIVVAAEPIRFGERLLSSTVREIEWSGEIRPEGSYKTIDDLIAGDSEEEARFAVTAMSTGEPILAAKITAPGQRAKLSTALTPGMKAVSIRVNDVLGVAGFVLPGDRVDILLTRSDFVDVLLQGIKVLAIDQMADERTDNPSVVRTVTFEVNTQEAQKLVLGANVGTLSLTLRNLASTDVEEIERVTVNDLNDFDIAEDMKPKPEEEEEAEEDLADVRFSALEAVISDLSNGMSERLQGVEDRLSEPQVPIVQEVVVEKVVEVEKIVEVVPPRPVRSTVGVIRNGQRNEYKVDRSGEDANLEDENISIVASDG